MSMKRAKQRSFGSEKDSEDERTTSYFAKPQAAEKTWEEHVKDKPDDAFTRYAIALRFDKGALVLHSKFGKGIVVGTTATNIEVLFQEGIKKLGHSVSQS
jgi:hypothetical protein